MHFGFDPIDICISIIRRSYTFILIRSPSYILCSHTSICIGVAATTTATTSSSSSTFISIYPFLTQSYNNIKSTTEC